MAKCKVILKNTNDVQVAQGYIEFDNIADLSIVVRQGIYYHYENSWNENNVACYFTECLIPYEIKEF